MKYQVCNPRITALVCLHQSIIFFKYAALFQSMQPYEGATVDYVLECKFYLFMKTLYKTNAWYDP